MSDQFFVEVDIASNPADLAQRGKDSLAVKWPGWIARDADLETRMFDGIAPLAGNAAEAASRLLAAAFRAYGTKLVGIPFNAGQAAVGTVTFTLTDDQGPYRIPIGYAISIDGFEFTVDADVDIVAGLTSVAGVNVTASSIGEAQNGLVGDVVTPISSLSFIQNVTLDAATNSGEEAQDDETYQSDLSLRLQLMADTLVTERDFEIFALLWPGIGRAVFVNDGERNIDGVVTDIEGEVVSTTIKNDLIAAMEELEQVNSDITVGDATYTTIDVTYSVKPYPFPSFDAADLLSRIDIAIASYLDPATYGTATSGERITTGGQWFSDTVIRVNKLIDLIADVDGVDYVDTVSIVGDIGDHLPSGDWNMDGTIALPRAGDITGSVI